MLSYSDLARDVGIAPNTAKQWVSALQASGQIFLLEPYHRNLGRRLVKSPKIYLTDGEFAAFLMGFNNWEAIERSPMVGALWQIHVVMEVVKHFASAGRSVPLWYWRTAYGAGVDLFIEQGGRFIAVEAKSSENQRLADLKGFQALESFYGEKSLISGWLAFRTPAEYPLASRITAIPAAPIAHFIE
jgi:predicted AAA+ superfamily ATPase